MNQIFYLKLDGEIKSGLTNQIYSLCSSILYCRDENKKIIWIQPMVKDINTMDKINISEVFDLEVMNEKIYPEYGILLLDCMKLNMKVISISRREEDREEWEELEMDEYLDINRKRFGISKDRIHDKKCIYKICYKMSGYDIIDYVKTELCEDNRYRLLNDYELCWDINWIQFYMMTRWRTKINGEDFDKLLSIIEFRDDFYRDVYQYLYKNELYNKKYHLIHLRLEDDAIEHWRIQDIFAENVIDGVISKHEYTYDEYKYLVEEKYIELIEKYIESGSVILLSGYCFQNRVYEYLRNHDY